MKILILEQDYLQQAFAYCQSHPADLPVHRQIESILAEQNYLGDSDQYALRALGCTVVTLLPSCVPLQQAWAREYGSDKTGRELLLAQITHEQPDVLYVHSGIAIDQELLAACRPSIGIAVCQWSCKLMDGYPYHAFDLLVSTARNFVEEFRQRGLHAEHLQHAFDTRQVLPPTPPVHDVIFCGALLPEHHSRRIRMLEEIATDIPFELFGPPISNLHSASPLHALYRGEAWGHDMLALLASSRVCLHIPGDAVLDDAGSKRLFEVTGMGSLLLTEKQPGLDELFVDGQEIVTFSSAQDCVHQLQYLLSHEEERRKIAMRGQARTLQDHTTSIRAKRLLWYLEQALSRVRYSHGVSPHSSVGRH